MVEIPPEDIPQLYASIMLEIKDRMQWCANEFGRSLEAKADPEKMFGAEVCYLNLRRMTELLAIGMVAAHNRDKKFRSTEFTTRNNSDKILAILQKRGGESFPQPVQVERLDDTRMQITPIPADREHLAGTRDDIRKLYVECGKALHTAHLRMIVNKDVYQYSSAVIARGMGHLAVLLEDHILAFPDGQALLTKMNFGKDEPTWSMWVDVGHAFPQPS